MLTLAVALVLHVCPQRIVVTAPSAHATTASLSLVECGRRVAGPFRARVGFNGLSAHHREGDGTTPLGTFAIGPTIYGLDPNPGVRLAYHRLRCGDWWDEDPASRRYNRFVALPCGVIPSFAARSEALWTEKVAYPYFAVIGFNAHPIRRGRRAPGSGIFLHSWTDAPTAGCVAIHRSRLLSLLRWLAPARHPVIAISVGRA
jgi:L,D-peptidoglycan transpeptidase YkuD (ErfK/YbiS/YcfS/YnhG family)